MADQSDNIITMAALQIARIDLSSRGGRLTHRMTDTTQIRIAQFGLGPIGIDTLRLLATKRWATIVGAVDIDPAKVGRTLNELGATGGQKCFASFDELATSDRPDVVIHTAGSKIGPAIEQIIPIARAGVSVVSSCEELLYPNHRDADAARQLDLVCRQSGARVVATGVNPGFVMDVLPICMTGVSRAVEAIHVQRVVNAITRRGPLQQKIGSGMRPEEFRAMFRAGRAGHAGLPESVSLIAHCMNWRIDSIAETCEPVVADREIQTRFFRVQPGQTCGLHQHAAATIGGRQRITMDLKMYLDAPDPHDALQIVGQPPLDVRINGGVAGDDATVAALVNTVPRAMKVMPGLKLMTDLPLPSFA
jgi:4-hydroxy-tetrahydrodipicolinate reductase